MCVLVLSYVICVCGIVVVVIVCVVVVVFVLLINGCVLICYVVWFGWFGECS